jgi:FKBP-type peptidyl-prolyl cis-trans isomerase FklB
MKHSLIATSLFALWYGMGAVGAPPAGGDEPAVASPGELTSNVDKINYSLGYELGEDLKREALEPRGDVLLKGVEDALSGAKPLVKKSGRLKALKEIKAQRAEANLELAQAFLAENAKKEGVVTLPSGLQYKEIQAGEGKGPTPTGRVTVNFRGSFIDGTEFASSYAEGKPSTFQVRKVIRGWKEALPLMKEGAKWELYIPPELGYGKHGLTNRIPPNTALLYEVELVAVDEGPPPPPRRTGIPRPPAAGASIRGEEDE